MQDSRDHQLDSSIFFVVAATVAAELHKAMLVAKEMSLIASNARAIAQRAGAQAAGFRALTSFIDELANKTVSTSMTINGLAIKTSKASVAAATNEFTSQKLERAMELGSGYTFIDSVKPALNKTIEVSTGLQSKTHTEVWKLKNALEEMANELRSATVVAAMARVEASQTDKELQQSLNVIAHNVSQSASKIQKHVKRSQLLFETL